MDLNSSSSQKQTASTFGFKWEKRDTYESKFVKDNMYRWLLEKYFDNEINRLDKILNEGSARKKILDAGCGSGFSSLLLFGERLRQHDFIGVDISNSVDVAKERFSERKIPGEFIQSDLNSIPLSDNSIDLIFSEGVLHHTDSVEAAIFNLSKLLKKGGKFMFYVYIKKAPIREYTDDLIREHISEMDNEESWEAIKPLTKLGKKLGELNLEIDIEDDIPFLGIEKGRQNIQRLFYYNICKAFYRPDFSLDEMNHINFDWFRPTNCFRHTPEEITIFCKKANLKIERLHSCQSGITIISSRI